MIENKKVFINLTNHPSSKWSEEQKKAASEYGEILDWPFPKISSEWDERMLEIMVNEYVGLAELHPPCSAVFHIMGELTFSFSLVEKLKKRGYVCVASTTERDVVEKADNVKETTFRFVRFRRY